MKRASNPQRIWILCVAGAVGVGLALTWRSSRKVPNGTPASLPPETTGPVATFSSPFGVSPSAAPNSAADSRTLSKDDGIAFQRGTAAFNEGRNAEAIREFERVVKINPSMPIARGYLGLAYLRQKRYTEAKKEFDEEARLLPNPAFAWAHIADVHVALGDLPAAIKALEKAAQLKPDVAQLHFNLGMLYPRALELGKGLEALERYIALEPRSHYGHYLRGNLLFKLARLDDAESALTEAIRLSPNASLYHYGLGQVHLLRKVSPETTERALAEFKLAMALGPTEPAAIHYHLGLCYQRKKDWEAARRELQVSTEMAPTAWRAFYSLAEALQELGRMEEASKARARFAVLRKEEDLRMQRSFHEQEVQRNPRSPEARYQLAEFLAKNGDRREAIKSIVRAGELARLTKTDPPLRNRIAELSERLSRTR